ncbi:MAG: armadillo/beta-catenin-like repeat-containing protein, partial [Thermoplasmata archaeon]
WRAAQTLAAIVRSGYGGTVVGAGAVEPLIHALSDENPGVRLFATWALYSIVEAGFWKDIENAGGISELEALVDDNELELKIWNVSSKKNEKYTVGKLARKTLNLLAQEKEKDKKIIGEKLT